MFNRNISKLIVTFAFFYSAVICHLKAIELYEKKELLLSYFLWFCALTSFLGGLRFQIAKIVDKFKSLKKWIIPIVINVSIFTLPTNQNSPMVVRPFELFQETYHI